MHVNSIHYHSERDEIVLSSRHWNEIWVIDHSTTTEEAAGSSGGQHGRAEIYFGGGGNPAAYGQGDENDQTFFGQHDAQFIDDDEGLISAFTTTASVDQMAATARCTTSLSPLMQTADTPGPVNRPSRPMQQRGPIHVREPGLIILLSQYLRL